MADTAEARRLYDGVPYGSKPYVESHPDRLATIARLLGLAPAPVERCRVLEIGCASGGNLVPMALESPDSVFVGIDISPVQIEDGRRVIAALGLSNLELRTLDLMEAGDDLGHFDYILCHGVYSWVPAPVQERLLAVIRDRLTPSGVAFLSFNAAPGWRLHGVLRDLMLFHVRGITDPAEQIAAAREVLATFVDALPPDEPHGMLLGQQKRMLDRLPDSYLFHDFLAPVNETLWFHAFAERMSRHRLQYLSNAVFSQNFAFDLSQEAQEQLAPLRGDPVRLSAYLDLLNGRGFREVLLVREELALDGQASWGALLDLYVTAFLKPVGEPDFTPGVDMDFQTQGGRVFAADLPVLKAATLELCERSPASFTIDELRLLAHARLGTDPSATVEQDREALCRNLLYAYAGDLVDLSTRRHRAATAPSDRPKVHPYVRLLAEHGSTWVPNLRHESVQIGTIERGILRQLDGTRDYDEVVAGMLELAAQGELSARDQDGNPIADPAIVREAIEVHVHVRFQEFAKLSLLVP